MRNTKLITISLPPELYEKARQRAKEEDRTRSGLLREALRRYLEPEPAVSSSRMREEKKPLK